MEDKLAFTLTATAFYAEAFPLAEPPLWPNTARMFGHDFLFGRLRPRSQFLSVPRLIPSLPANVFIVILLLMRKDTNVLAMPVSQGGESTLTALITRWQ